MAAQHIATRLTHIATRVKRLPRWEQVALPGDIWVPVEEAVATLKLLEAEAFPRLTHGICEHCRIAWEAKAGTKY